MIRVDIARERNTQRIVGYRVEGHAHFDEPGKDIVCAGVSAVTVGTVNAAEAVVGVAMAAEMDESGMLQVLVPKELSEQTAASLQLLLESMVVMLQSIEESYGEHIRLYDQYE